MKKKHSFYENSKLFILSMKIDASMSNEKYF